jgi:hypothetical protein
MSALFGAGTPKEVAACTDAALLAIHAWDTVAIRYSMPRSPGW